MTSVDTVDDVLKTEFRGPLAEVPQPYNSLTTDKVHQAALASLNTSTSSSLKISEQIQFPSSDLTSKKVDTLATSKLNPRSFSPWTPHSPISRVQNQGMINPEFQALADRFRSLTPETISSQDIEDILLLNQVKEELQSLPKEAVEYPESLQSLLRSLETRGLAWAPFEIPRQELLSQVTSVLEEATSHVSLEDLIARMTPFVNTTRRYPNPVKEVVEIGRLFEEVHSKKVKDLKDEIKAMISDTSLLTKIQVEMSKLPDKDKIEVPPSLKELLDQAQKRGLTEAHWDPSKTILSKTEKGAIGLAVSTKIDNLKTDLQIKMNQINQIMQKIATVIEIVKKMIELGNRLSGTLTSNQRRGG
jgi:hypothetical protein